MELFLIIFKLIENYSVVVLNEAAAYQFFGNYECMEKNYIWIKMLLK